jgi:protein-S-isoprenylcysteine O-methyltransferase Ste14
MLPWLGSPSAFRPRRYRRPISTGSYIFIGGGFILISVGWKALYDAPQEQRLATSGIYSYVRHPQYGGFIAVMFGFLLQWPTLLTLAMFPVLVFMYVRLARSEEREALAEFGDDYARYMRQVPGFIPRIADLIGRPMQEG